jgi:hypothetical protein
MLFHALNIYLKQFKRTDRYYIMVVKHIVFDKFSTTRNGKVYNKPTVFKTTKLNSAAEFDAVNTLVNMKRYGQTNSVKAQTRYNLRR